MKSSVHDILRSLVARKDKNAPHPLSLTENMIYYGFEKPANWFRKRWDKRFGKFVKINSADREGPYKPGTGWRYLTDSKYGTAGGGDTVRFSNSNRKSRSGSGLFGGSYGIPDFRDLKRFGEDQLPRHFDPDTPNFGTAPRELGGHRYFVRELKTGDFDIYDNKKNKVVRQFQDREEALNQCYYLNWENEQRFRNGMGNRTKGILLGLTTLTLASAIPVLVGGGLEWWLRGKDKHFDRVPSSASRRRFYSDEY